MIAALPTYGNWRTCLLFLFKVSLLSAVCAEVGLPNQVQAQEKIPFEFKSGPVDSIPDDSQQGSWQTLESGHTVIYYHQLKELKKFDRKIDYSPFKSSFKSIFNTTGNGNLRNKIGRKIDRIFFRVQEILDMRKRLPKVNIKIFSDQDSFARVLRQHGGNDRHARAWYAFESKTIHLNLQDLNEGILAHEIAHHIIDHYLTVRPPRATAEILARYVDEHLYY